MMTQQQQEQTQQQTWMLHLQLRQAAHLLLLLPRLQQ
jgi:hypothetical protein